MREDTSVFEHDGMREDQTINGRSQARSYRQPNRNVDSPLKDEVG